jgi:hypothetical protein
MKFHIAYCKGAPVKVCQCIIKYTVPWLYAKLSMPLSTVHLEQSMSSMETDDMRLLEVTHGPDLLSVVGKMYL